MSKRKSGFKVIDQLSKSHIGMITVRLREWLFIRIKNQIYGVILKWQKLAIKTSALINMIADYFNDRYGTAIVVISNGEEMQVSGRNYNSEQVLSVGTAMIENELKEVLEEDTPDENLENRKIAEILRAMGKEN